MNQQNINKNNEFDEIQKKFQLEEEQRRTDFEKSLARKRSTLERLNTDNNRITRARIEADLARKKFTIDTEIRARINSLWAECEEKIKELANETEKKIEEMTEKKNAELQARVEEVRSHFAAQIATRKLVLEDEIKRIQEIIAKEVSVDDSLEDRRPLLKKELVEFKLFPATKEIADEEALKRMGVTINKQSVFTSRECILYRGMVSNQQCLVKIVIISDRSGQYRANVRNSSKVARNLMCGNNGEPRHPIFLKCYGFFLSDKKSYAFLEECSTISLEARARNNQINEAQVKDTLRQVLAGMEFMHTRAIAHLNIRADSVIYTIDGTSAKLVGLGYAQIYFNPDTEKFFNLPKIDRKREFFPTEVYLDENFEPRAVDCYSFGYLLYLVLSEMFKKQRTRKIGHIDYDNLNSRPPAKALVEATTNRDPTKRLKIGDLKSQPYFVQA